MHKDEKMIAAISNCGDGKLTGFVSTREVGECDVVYLVIVLDDGVLLFMLLLLLYNNIVDVVNQKRLGYQVYQHKSD